MKRQVLAVMLLTLPLLCGCALIMGPEVTGRWEGTATFKLGSLIPMEIVLVMGETDGTITGSLEWFETYVGAMATDITGKRTGSSIAIEGTVHGSLLTLEGGLSRRTIAGTCTTAASRIPG